VPDFDPDYTTTEFEHAVFKGVEASFSNPYPVFNTLTTPAEPGASDPAVLEAHDDPEVPAPLPIGAVQRGGAHYSGDLVGDADRYARLVVALARHERFDVVHAHDWLTYPAGIAIAGVTGKPLVVHVHSTEFDRSGDNIHQQLYDIERRGMHMADRVIAVSEFTKSICVERYGVAVSKVDVVYNGIDRDADQPEPGAQISSKDKIVLFLGRITMQKGPEYFIAAAKRVLEKIKNVKFVVAGSGDMTTRMIELAAQMGIGSKVLFTGFLRGRDVERVFGMADCYVMPSVSEPFGISALEAVHHDVPVIISKQSGVSEVLTHVLKVDFWDTDEMANKIVAVLRHPPLSQTLREHGPFELRRLTWEGAAEKCVRSYGRATAEHHVVKLA
jgi:glycogen(starch) synthase